MHSRDKEKPTFMTDCNNFYYEFMPFGLKNVGAIPTTIGLHLKKMLDHTIEVYVDDIVVKTDSCQQHIKYLQEVFQALRDHVK